MLTEATIFRGAFWSAIGAVLERTMYFLLPIFIAPLGPLNLGIFYISLRIFHGTVSFPASVLNSSYSHRLRQYLEDPKSLKFEETAALLLKVYLLVGLLTGMFFFILILTLAPLKSLAFLALAIPFAIINSYTILLLRFLQRFSQIFFIQAVFIFLFQLLYMTIFIGFFHFGIVTALVGQLLSTILISVAASFFIFDRINLLGLFQKLNLKIFRVSLLSFANALFTTISPIIDIAFVGLMFGFSTLGRYIVLLYLPLLMHKIPTTLFGMFIHVAAVKTRNNENITKISMRVFKWILIITIPLFVIIIIYPSLILSLLFHKSYVKDLNVTQLLAISFFIQSVSWTAGRILIAKKKNLLNTITNYIFLFVFISFSLLLTSPFGLYGIATAYLISSILDVFVKYVFVTKKTNVFFIAMDHIKILCAGTIGAILAYTLFFSNPLLFFSFFLIVYFAILWLTRVISQRTLFELKKMVVKETIGETDYD